MIYFNSEATFDVITRMSIAQNLHAFFVAPGRFSSWITDHLHLAIKIFLLASNTMTAKHSMIFLTSATPTTSFHSDASVIFFSISLTASLKPWLYACSLSLSKDIPQCLHFPIFPTYQTTSTLGQFSSTRCWTDQRQKNNILTPPVTLVFAILVPISISPRPGRRRATLIVFNSARKSLYPIRIPE